ncbi:MAG TPA: hypothetical protein VFZ53_30775 [Polyangiaceae bacterium]
MTRAFSLVAFSALVVGCGAAPVRPPAAAATKAPPTASSLVRATLDRYRAAQTYEDRGSSVTFFREDDGERTERSTLAFRTAFDRANGRFLFDYTKAHRESGDPTRGVIWRETAGDARAWASFRPEIQELEPERAIASLTGVSGGTAWNVPAMLFGIGSVWDRGPAARLADLPLVVERSEPVRGTACVKVSARRGEHEISVWIGTNDQAVHRIFERRRIVPKKRSPEEILARLPAELSDDVKLAVLQAHEKAAPFVAEQSIDYEPTFDGAIDGSRFHFVPPAGDESEIVSRIPNAWQDRRGTRRTP